MKYQYYRVIQQHTNYGWEDVDYHEANSDLTAKNPKEVRENLKAYRENQKGSVRVIGRKVKNY